MRALKTSVEDRDKRTGSRQQVTWDGIITYGDDRRRAKCGISNISAEGAQLLVEPNTRLPDQFELLMPNGSKAFQCRMAWRDKLSVGVEFVRAHPAASKSKG